jgi:hypothetical protein
MAVVTARPPNVVRPSELASRIARQRAERAAMKARGETHRRTLEKIRRDSDERIRKMRAEDADLRRKWEALSLSILRDAVTSASRAARFGLKAPTLPLALAQQWQDVHCHLANVTPRDEVTLVPIWKAHVREVARHLQVAIEWAATPMNAYAWAKSRRIEVSPIITGADYATVLHELGHCAWPCEPTHAPVIIHEKLKKSCCVACELAAWQWAQRHARPGWTSRMHDCLSRSLTTYRTYGTAPEQRTIDEMVSPVGFRAAQLARHFEKEAA